MASKAARFESLVEAVPNAIVGTDRAGVIRFVNHQTESLFGYNHDDLIGQPFQRLVPGYRRVSASEHRIDEHSPDDSPLVATPRELTARRGDGTGIRVQISESALDTGEALFVISATGSANRDERAPDDVQRLA